MSNQSTQPTPSSETPNYSSTENQPSESVNQSSPELPVLERLVLMMQTPSQPNQETEKVTMINQNPPSPNLVNQNPDSMTTQSNEDENDLLEVPVSAAENNSQTVRLSEQDLQLITNRIQQFTADQIQQLRMELTEEQSHQEASIQMLN